VYEGHTHVITKVIELFNGNLASCSKDRTINVWDRASGEIINTLEGFEVDIKDIIELDTENLIILLENDPEFPVWSYKKELEDNCKYYADHEGFINKIIVVNHKYIFTASQDKTIKKWNPKNDHSAEVSYQGHTNVVFDVVFIDNKKVASASADKTIKIWEISTKYCVNTL
jgi:WD40 repeat protein